MDKASPNREQLGQSFRNLEDRIFAMMIAGSILAPEALGRLYALRINRADTRDLVAAGAGQAILDKMMPQFERPDQVIGLGVHWSKAEGSRLHLATYVVQGGVTINLFDNFGLSDDHYRLMQDCADRKLYEYPPN